MMSWIFYFGWVKSLVIMERHYEMIIMQTMIVEMVWNGYVIIFWLCWCSFIWVLVVLSWWVMSYSLGYFQSLCMKILWMYKRDTVKGSYSSGRESERSGGYAGDDVYGGYSGKSSSYDEGYGGCCGDLYR
eukprot:126407_1